MPDSIAWAMDGRHCAIIWLLMRDATILSNVIMIPDVQHWVIIILMPYWANIEPTLSQWAILMPFAQHWAILMLNALLHWAEQLQFTFELGAHTKCDCEQWASASCVIWIWRQWCMDSKSWKLGYILRKKASCRKSLSLHQFKSNKKCIFWLRWLQKGQKQILSIAPCTDLHYISLASSNFSSFFFYFVCNFFV